MYKTLFAVFAFLPTIAMAVLPESQLLSRAESKIDAMYKDLKTISNTTLSVSRVSETKLHFADKYFLVSDQDAPNEFKSIGVNDQAQSYTTDIRVDNYVNQFYDLFRNHKYPNCSFSYERQHSSIVNEPEFKKGEAPAKLAQIIVRKKYSCNNKILAAFEDTLVIGLEKLKVHKWANETSKHHIGDYGGSSIMNIEQLKVDAALAYNKKQYNKAYLIYEKIVNKYPNEGDPYYRMAIMLYKKEYGSSFSKKERQGLILDYLDKAIKFGGYSTKACADNMKYWLTC